MAIWFTSMNLKALNARSENTLAAFLDIQFTDIQENALLATMPVVNKTKQPIGLLHGGANVVLAETIASTAANMVVDPSQFYCVGLEINANHVKSARDGYVTGKTYPIHIGRTTQIWHIEIKNDRNELTCISRMTAAVIAR